MNARKALVAAAFAVFLVGMFVVTVQAARADQYLAVVLSSVFQFVVGYMVGYVWGDL